jgi:hypothetical protein
VRSVEIAVLPEAFDQSWHGVASSQRREDGQAVDDQHGGSVALAAGSNGGDDRFAPRAAGAGMCPSEKIDDGWMAGNGSNSASAKSESETAAAAARARSARWTSSGTLRT